MPRDNPLRDDEGDNQDPEGPELSDDLEQELQDKVEQLREE